MDCFKSTFKTSESEIYITAEIGINHNGDVSIAKKLIEDGLIKLGALFHKKLNELKSKYPEHIQHVFGNGLLAALIFRDKNNNNLSELCDKVSEKAFQKGLLVVHTGRESIKLAPPLTINEEALNEGIEVLEESIKESI